MPEQNKQTQPVPNREQKKALVSTPVVERKKKGITERLVNGLIGPNGIRAIGSYIGREILLPMAKNVTVDSLTTALNMAVFGDQGSRNNNRSNNGRTNYQRSNQNNRTNYQSQYTNNQIAKSNVANTTIYTVRDVAFGNRDEAMMVLDTMRNNIDEYGQVSVADFYDWVGMSNITTYADVNYGWVDLYTARVVALRGNAFGITLPPVEPIDS